MNKEKSAMMPIPKIVTIQTANPGQVWTQEEICRTVFDHPRISGRGAKFYERFLKDEAILTRHFVIDRLETVYDESPDKAIHRFQKVSVDMGSRAVAQCLRTAGIEAHSVDALIVTTCTGYLCPGLSSYLSELLGFRENIFTLDLVGLGCGAAIPALRTGAELIKSGQTARVVVACIEVCSAALFWGDDVDLILSNCIFSDGAAACLLSRGERGAQGYEFVQFESLLWPQYRDDLRFKYRDSRLCNIIHKNVPMIAAKAVTEIHKILVPGKDGKFDYYAVHTGGRKILDEVERALGLGEPQMRRSREVLRDYGNMSSPSVLFVLKEIFEKDKPREGEHLMVFSFGAGFSAFGMILKASSSLP